MIWLARDEKRENSAFARGNYVIFSGKPQKTEFGYWKVNTPVISEVEFEEKDIPPKLRLELGGGPVRITLTTLKSKKHRKQY